jgi:uncharacterized iron-regulated protein
MTSKQAGESVGKVTARERARLAKATLDAERATREKRIEDAATEFYVAADQRDGALAKVSEAESAMSRAIASLVTQDETVERIAALCGIQTSEVRRLRNLSADTASAAHVSAKSTVVAAVLVEDTTSDNVAADPVQLSA